MHCVIKPEVEQARLFSRADCKTPFGVRYSDFFFIHIYTPCFPFRKDALVSSAYLYGNSGQGYDFYFALPLERRYRGSSVIDIRIRSANGNYIWMNHKMSPLDITEDGRIRLGLCVLTSPASKTPVTSYLKMSDDHTVYEYIEKTKKFVQVKVQRLTPKSEKVWELAGCGKTEKEIADTLGISLNTVKYHKRMILRQLNVRNTTEAVQWVNSQKTLADTI